MSYTLKRQWERFQKNFIVKCSLKRTLGQTLAHPLRVHPWIFIVIFFSWRENSSSILLIQWDWLRDCESLVVKHLNTRDGLSLCGSDFVKGFYKHSGNLKWVAWVLDVGTGCGRTSIKLCFPSLFPYLIYVIAINFVLHVYRTLLNWLLLLLLHSKPIPLKIIEVIRSNRVLWPFHY